MLGISKNNNDIKEWSHEAKCWWYITKNPFCNSVWQQKNNLCIPLERKIKEDTQWNEPGEIHSIV